MYMINPSGSLDVFDLDDVTSGLFQPFSHDGVDMGAIMAAQEFLYILRPPRRQFADRSIGTIEKYAVMLHRN